MLLSGMTSFCPETPAYRNDLRVPETQGNVGFYELEKQVLRNPHNATASSLLFHKTPTFSEADSLLKLLAYRKICRWPVVSATDSFSLSLKFKAK